MSEFQHYEFHAIDRRLDDEALEFLHSRSTRAEITPYSFVNEYNWGGLKGDPVDWMKRFFDAYLYYANWGTHTLMLRIPRKLCDLDTARLYIAEPSLDVIETKEHVIFAFTAHSEDADWDQLQADLTPLLPLRNELLVGDYRCLYLGWLAGVTADDVDADETEPPLPPGMAYLTLAQQALVDFLWLDDDLVEVATAPGSGEAPTEPTPEVLAAWVAKLPVAEKNAYLVRLLQGEGLALGQELLGQFRHEQWRTRVAPGKVKEKTSRIVAELRAAWEDSGQLRRVAEQEREAAEVARREREQAAARSLYLDQLAKRQPKAWDEVETMIASKLPKKYDEAATLLKDLRDVAKRSNHEPEFATRFQQLSDRHASKRSLMERFRKAGLRDVT